MQTVEFQTVEMVPKKNYTIRDIARIAQVTPGTVSRALNDNPLVNKDTRDRILKIAKDLDYTPNLAARRLSTGRTFAIGIIVPFFTRPSVSERLDGVVSALSNSQYDLVIHNVETDEQRKAGFRGVLRRERIDGALILSMPILETDVENLKSADIPVVLVDVKHPDLHTFDRVAVDDIEGGYKATRHLIELGHTKIGYIGDITEMMFFPEASKSEINDSIQFSSSRDRFNGYKSALQEAGLDFNPAYCAEEKHGFRQAGELARGMLNLREPPTAFFASNDIQAFEIIQEVRASGKSIPEDISVVGYDDIQAAEFMELTTVRQRLFESGRQGAEILMEKMNGHSDSVKHEILSTEIIVRKTTAPLSNKKGTQEDVGGEKE